MADTHLFQPDDASTRLPKELGTKGHGTWGPPPADDDDDDDAHLDAIVDELASGHTSRRTRSGSAPPPPPPARPAPRARIRQRSHGRRSERFTDFVTERSTIGPLLVPRPDVFLRALAVATLVLLCLMAVGAGILASRMSALAEHLRAVRQQQVAAERPAPADAELLDAGTASHLVAAAPVDARGGLLLRQALLLSASNRHAEAVAAFAEARQEGAGASRPDEILAEARSLSATGRLEAARQALAGLDLGAATPEQKAAVTDLMGRIELAR